MCFGSSDMRGAAPTGLDTPKPARISSIASRGEREQTTSSPVPKSQSKPWEVRSKYKSKEKSKEGEEDEGYGESHGLSLAAKGRKRGERLEEEVPGYDPVHGRDVKETGIAQGNLGGPLGGGAGMALSSGF